MRTAYCHKTTLRNAVSLVALLRTLFLWLSLSVSSSDAFLSTTHIPLARTQAAMKRFEAMDSERKDDLTLMCEEDNCRLVDFEEYEIELGKSKLQENLSEYYWQQQDATLDWFSSPNLIWDKLLLPAKPLVLMLLAFCTYDPMASFSSSLIDDWLAQGNSWVAVDGGSYQATIIAPAINGVVVPAISLLFASLISTTISSLKQRQEKIQVALQLEATQLRILERSLRDLFVYIDKVDTSSHWLSLGKCRNYLFQYAIRIRAETDENVNVQSLMKDSFMDSEIHGLLGELYRVAPDSQSQGTSEDGISSACRLPPTSSLLWSHCVEACYSLVEQRALRMTALQATFPTLHYGLLSGLGTSLLLAFLMETNQDILVFLNAIQLRLLWSILVGTFSVLGLVSYDLNHPFRGSYRIARGSVDQLNTIVDCLRLDLKEHSMEQGKYI